MGMMSAFLPWQTRSKIHMTTEMKKKRHQCACTLRFVSPSKFAVWT
jgi:hypothetical protein